MASVIPATPDAGLNAHASELSPPSSQGVPLASPTNGSHGANANGKRPLSTLDVNGDAYPPSRSTVPTTSEPGVVHTHEASGYKWTKQEDEPGWAWKNKKALDEYHRAYDTLVMKDLKIGGELILARSQGCLRLTTADRYGDPFAMADEELATMRSQTQQ